MKPIYFVMTKGPELAPTLGGLQQLINTVFLDKNFSFKQLMTISGKANVSSFVNPSGQEFTCLAVLEADSIEDVNELIAEHGQQNQT